MAHPRNETREAGFSIPDSLAPEVLSIVEAAVLAPSADNHHTFLIRASKERIDLTGGPAYVGAPYHRKILSLISFGAAVENMMLRAARLGISAGLAWWPEGADRDPIARLTLAPGERVASALEAAIPSRHTNRSVVFSGPHLDAEQQAAFSHLVSDIPGAELFWFTEGADRNKLLRLIWIAETERFHTAPLHAELFGSIR
jgi:hypothetical protein